MNYGQKYIYVIVMHPNSVVSSLIHVVTRESFTHSLLAFSPELSPMFSFGRKYRRFPFWGCYKQERLGDRFYQAARHIPGRVIAITVTDRQYKLAHDKVEGFWQHREQLKYNISGFICNAFGIAHARPSHYTCSQFVSEVLSDAGIRSFAMPHALIRPSDLARLDGEVIFDGDLKEYLPFSMFSEKASTSEYRL